VKSGGCLGAFVTALTIALTGVGAAQSPDPLKAEFVVRDLANQIEAGSTTSVLLEVHNRGTERWPAQGDVRIAYHWLDAAGSMVTRDGERTQLPASVRPGSSTRICATVVAPHQPGEYVIEWEMVKEGVRWFAGGDEASRRRRVVVSAAALPSPYERPPSSLLVFSAITLGHFFLTALWLRLAGWYGGSRDERLFADVLAGVGTLLAVLHAVACSVGLSLVAVSVAFAVWHLILGAFVTLGGGRSRGDVERAGTDGLMSSRAESLFEWAGIVVLIAIGIQWFSTSTASMVFAGTDAAHYHVPNAVNFSLGANPLDFVATPHLYPMGTSVLAAWLILPVGDPLLVDFTMALPALLAFSALAWLFRQVSGASGLAWVPWFALVIFATPMLQISSEMSADLMYAAGFLAANTQLFRIWRAKSATPLDLALTALAIGLLLGSKTTGLVSAGLLGVVYGSAILLSWRNPSTGRPSMILSLRGFALAALLLIAAGGIWPIRNWVNYGSPLAPSGLTVLGRTVFPGDTVEDNRYYLSVMRDLRDTANYNLLSRTNFFVGNLFGRWLLPSILGVLPMIFDAVYARRRRYANDRLGLVAVAVAITLPHLALLIQAPWSSLEWTNGLALRYALPFFILWPFLAFLALFPLNYSWTQRFWPAIAIGATLMVTALMLFARSGRMPGLPPLDTASIALIALGVAVMVTFRGGQHRRRSQPIERAAGLALAVTLIWVVSSRIAIADERLRNAAPWGRKGPLECAGGRNPVAPDSYSAAYWTVLDYERQTPRRCEKRRFFVTARFDQPLALQPPPFANVVVDVRPRTIVERTMHSDGPGAGECDYVIASQAELANERGNPLINRLRAEGTLDQIGVAPPYVIFSASRR
jgi:hypothetical protein